LQLKRRPNKPTAHHIANLTTQPILVVVVALPLVGKGAAGRSQSIQKLVQNQHTSCSAARDASGILVDHMTSKRRRRPFFARYPGETDEDFSRRKETWGAVLARFLTSRLSKRRRRRLRGKWREERALLSQAWTTGVDSGDAGGVDFDALKKEARARRSAARLRSKYGITLSIQAKAPLPREAFDEMWGHENDGL